MNSVENAKLRIRRQYITNFVSTTQQITQQCKPNFFFKGSLLRTNPGRTYMHTFAPDIPYTIMIYNQLLPHSKIGIHHQYVDVTKSGLTEMGNRLERHYNGYTETREKTCQIKPLWGKNMKNDRKSGQEPQPNSEQLAAHPSRLHR